VALVERVLAGAGLTAAHLGTPEAWPSSSSATHERVRRGLGPARITMNCSGNHAGMLAGSVAAGWPVDDYLDAGHPIHALAAEVIGELAGVDPGHRGIDGCGGPVWALPLTALGRGYQAVARVEPRIAAAVRRQADVIEGPGTATSRAIEALGVFAKSGAEGVFCAVAPDGTAVAVKTLDGSGRAAAAVSVALLAAAGAVDASAAARFLDDASLAVLGGGVPVGRTRPLIP
jgi:L-asparaginase II